MILLLALLSGTAHAQAQTAVLIGLKQGAAASLTLSAEQALMLDVDADGQVEAIIRNRETRTVQVWGAGTTNTATEEDIERALYGLFQNYPNKEEPL